MARSIFGGALTDVSVALVSGFLKPTGPITLSLWSAETGGAPVTDLLLAGQPVTAIKVGSEGDIPAFEGPDGVNQLWVKIPGRTARRLLAATGKPGTPGEKGATGAKGDTGERGVAGYNAMGTEPQQQTLADWTLGTAGPNAFRDAQMATVGGAIDAGMAPGGVIRTGVTPIAQAAASDAIANNPNVVTQAGAAAAAAASTAVTIAGVSDGYTAPPATPAVTLGTLNPVSVNFAGGRRVLIAVADTHKITQPSVLRSMSGRVANDEAARTIEFYVYRPNGSGGYTVVYRGGAQAAATAGTYTWTPASYLRLLPGDVPGVWTATNVAANGLYWAGSGGPAIGSIVYQPAVNFPAPAVGDTITPGAGASDPKVQTQYLPALTWTTSHEAVVVASRWANLPGGYPRLDAGGKVPANLLPGARVTGLPMIALGTSVVAIANSYVTQAAAQSGVALDNQAVGSSGIVWDGTRDRSLSATKAELEAAFPGWGGQSYEARIIDRIANIKHLHFAHGYNDRDKPIGTPTSTDRATLYGAYNYVLGKVFEAKPSITVSFETPHSLYTPANEGYHATTAAVRTAILELGQRYGGPVFDLTQHGQLGQSGATTRTTDGVHPNAAWNTMLAPVLAAWWNEHLPVG